MTKLLNEISDDLKFIKSHTLQPRWYKIAKIFILLGFLLGYWYLSGWLKTVIFLAIFMFLSFMLHLLYRVQTKKYTQSWLDFVVIEENNVIKAKSIGKFYYLSIFLNAILSLGISQCPYKLGHLAFGDNSNIIIIQLFIKPNFNHRIDAILAFVGEWIKRPSPIVQAG
jgi:hypothetical protein